MLADTSRVLEDFGRIGVALLRHVAGLLEQRQIDVRLDVALRTGIAIPVPSAAEVAALLDNADTFHARFAKARRCEQTAEASADNHRFHRIVHRLARESRIDVRVVYIATEV